MATPTFSPAAGTYVGPLSVTISCATAGATIYYTTDGSTPTSSSPQYSAPLNLTASTIISAYAASTGMTDSAVASAAYTIYMPASGGAGQPTPNTSATETNPVDGTTVTVTSSDGGVMQLAVSGSNWPAGSTVSTTYNDANGNTVTVQGASPFLQFTAPGIYVVAVTVTDASGSEHIGTEKITLPIGAAETGETVATTPPGSMAISSVH